MTPHSSGHRCPQQLTPRARPQPRQPPQSQLSHGLYQLGEALEVCAGDCLFSQTAVLPNTE